jgi:glycosyltransferase involved in cell wall biosynthesis
MPLPGQVERAIAGSMTRNTAFVLKGYPRLSETFIAQEILGLERAGLPLEIVSLRAPTDKARHPVHDEISARITYLPEYVKDEPARCFKAWWKVRRLPGYASAWAAFRQDYARDRTPNRARRFVQAMVLAAERGEAVDHLHAHFIHTPASVTRYAAMMLGLPWSISAHAKDIWTSPDWDLADKLNEADWTVTCTGSGHKHLQSLTQRPDHVHLSYHGLDLSRFAPFPARHHVRDGSAADDPVRIVSVGRAVLKKGFDTLLEALAQLPEELNWQFDHIGGGELLDQLKAQAGRLGIAGRITWHGAQSQERVIALYREADIFVLPSRIAPDGDRDGLPNVLVEAASQRLACLSTTISGIPELIEDGRHGLLVEPEDAQTLCAGLLRLARDPKLRQALGDAADERVREHFDHVVSIRQLMALFAGEQAEPSPQARQMA